MKKSNRLIVLLLAVGFALPFGSTLLAGEAQPKQLVIACGPGGHGPHAPIIYRHTGLRDGKTAGGFIQHQHRGMRPAGYVTTTQQTSATVFVQRQHRGTRPVGYVAGR